jgi:hypothetical protein
MSSVPNGWVMWYVAPSTTPETRTRIRPKLICCFGAGRPSALPKAASTAVTSSAFSPPPASIGDSALDQKASSGKLFGKLTGLCGFGTSPMMQYGSLGSRHSSSRTLFVSLYQIGKPLASSIGPTCLRPTVWLLWAGGGAAATAAITPLPASARTATPEPTERGSAGWLRVRRDVAPRTRDMMKPRSGGLDRHGLPA